MVRRLTLGAVALLALIAVSPAAGQAPPAGAGNICTYDFLRPSLGEGGCTDSGGNPVLCPAEAEDILVENLADLCVDLDVTAWPSPCLDDQILKTSAGALVCAPDAGGGDITVEEVDGAPTGTASTLRVDQADGLQLTDETGGTFRLDLASVPLDALAVDVLEETELDSEAELEAQIGVGVVTPAEDDDVPESGDFGAASSLDAAGALLADVVGLAELDDAAATPTDGDLLQVAGTGTRVSYLTIDPEEETHAAEHQQDAADELLVEDLGTGCTVGQSWTADGAGGVDCADSGDAALLFSSGSGGGVTTTYLGQGATSATESAAALVSPVATTATALYCQASAAPGAGESWTLTLRVAGASSALTCAITDAATTCSDTANTAALAAGDLLAIQATASTAPASTDLACGVRIPGGGGGGGGGSDPWAGQYHPDREPATCWACEEWAGGAEELTWTSGGSAKSVTLTRDAAVISSSADSSDYGCSWVSAPADGDWVASLKLVPQVFNNDSELALATLVSGTVAAPLRIDTSGFRSPSASNMTAMGHTCNSGSDYTPDAVRYEEDIGGADYRIDGAMYFQLRYDDTASTLSTYWSTDGRYWQPGDLDRAVAAQPVYAGYCIRDTPASTSSTSQGEILWFRVRTDAAGLTGEVGE